MYTFFAVISLSDSDECDDAESTKGGEWYWFENSNVHIFFCLNIHS
jgi:hypothetical protein